MALDVTLSALSELLGDCGSLVEELLKALTRVFKANDFPLMAEMCQLFLPAGKRLARTRVQFGFCDFKTFFFCGSCAGIDSVAVYKQKLQSNERSLAASESLEALVCYQLMYKRWWKCSGLEHINGHQMAVENGDAAHESEPGDTEGSLEEDFWNVLLSEPHAALQSTQRALEAIQSRVAVMIQQHSCLQVESADLMHEHNTAGGSGGPETR